MDEVPTIVTAVLVTGFAGVVMLLLLSFMTAGSSQLSAAARRYRELCEALEKEKATLEARIAELEAIVAAYKKWIILRPVD